jgi:ribosomal protein S18 acetylase RimI-like enzyme
MPVEVPERVLRQHVFKLGKLTVSEFEGWLRQKGYSTQRLDTAQASRLLNVWNPERLDADVGIHASGGNLVRVYTTERPSTVRINWLDELAKLEKEKVRPGLKRLGQGALEGRMETLAAYYADRGEEKSRRQLEIIAREPHAIDVEVYRPTGAVELHELMERLPALRKELDENPRLRKHFDRRELDVLDRLVIRNAHTTDLQSIMELENRAFKPDYRGSSEVFGHRLENAREWFLVAELFSTPEERRKYEQMQEMVEQGKAKWHPVKGEKTPVTALWLKKMRKNVKPPTGTLIGYLFGMPTSFKNHSHWLPDKVVPLDHMGLHEKDFRLVSAAVHPEHEGLGIMRFLASEMFHHVAGENYSRIFGTPISDKMTRFWETLGFEREASEPFAKANVVTYLNPDGRVWIEDLGSRPFTQNRELQTRVAGELPRELKHAIERQRAYNAARDRPTSASSLRNAVIESMVRVHGNALLDEKIRHDRVSFAEREYMKSTGGGGKLAQLLGEKYVRSRLMNFLRFEVRRVMPPRRVGGRLVKPILDTTAYARMSPAELINEVLRVGAGHIPENYYPGVRRSAERRSP